jgi:hypothetical protein
LNKDIYKDEFGQYHEVDEEVEDPIDGLEDDEQDPSEEVDDLADPFELAEDDNEYDEDEAYANERRTDYDSEED